MEIEPINPKDNPVKKIFQLESSPIIIRVINRTDQKKTAYLLGTLKNDLGISINLIFDYKTELFNLWLLKNLKTFTKLRVSSSSPEFMFKSFRHISHHPSGQALSQPLFICGNNITPNSVQYSMADCPINILLDGVSSDIGFELEPNESMEFYLFENSVYSDKIDYNTENIDIFSSTYPSIVVDNKGDRDIELDIFSEEEYVDNCKKKNSYIKYYNIHSGESQFGKTFSNDKEYMYLNEIKRLRKDLKTYDCVRIVSSKENTPNSVVANRWRVHFNNHNERTEKIDKIVNVTNFEDIQFYDSFIIKVPAKTKMMISFGTLSEIKSWKPKQYK